MSEYRVAVKLVRDLAAEEFEGLTAVVASPIAGYDRDGDNVVLVSVQAVDALTACDTAAIHVQRGTGVEIELTQLVP